MQTTPASHISLQVCGQEGVLKLRMVSTCGLPFETCVRSIYENNLYTVLFKDFKGLVCQSSQLWQGSVLEDLHLVWVSAEGLFKSDMGLIAGYIVKRGLLYDD